MLRPYLKFLIAGGIVTGEGGGALASGLMFLMLSNLMNSMMSSYPSWSNPNPFSMFTYFSIPFLVAGIVSLIIGLSLLGTGVSRRKEYLLTHPQDAKPGIARMEGARPSSREQPYPDALRAPSFEQSTTRQPAASSVSTQRRCNNCGMVLLADADTKFCPSCGNRI